MSDIFISYKREDEQRVARIVLALEKHGLTVWWDRGLPSGELWRANIEAALAASKCVVVIWTEASTGLQGSFVRDEASRGAARHILVPVMLDKVTIPVGFGELQAVDLSHWRKSPRDPFFLDLVAAVRAKIEGRPAPAPQGPMRRLLRRLTLGSLASALAIAGGAFATNTLNIQNQVCALPIAQPEVSDLCGALSLGGRPTGKERVSWEQREPGSCDALRTHIQRFPDGAFRAKADALITAKTLTTTETWHRSEKLLNIYVGTDAPPTATQTSAQAVAITRGKNEAERQCRDFAVTGLFKFQDTEVKVQSWNCSQVSGGRVCGFEGQAVCVVDERKKIETERCDESPGRIGS